jgi:hypothetical protein
VIFFNFSHQIKNVFYRVTKCCPETIRNAPVTNDCFQKNSNSSQLGFFRVNLFVLYLYLTTHHYTVFSIHELKIKIHFFLFQNRSWEVSKSCKKNGAFRTHKLEHYSAFFSIYLKGKFSQIRRA